MKFLLVILLTCLFYKVSFSTNTPAEQHSLNHLYKSNIQLKEIKNFPIQQSYVLFSMNNLVPIKTKSLKPLFAQQLRLQFKISKQFLFVISYQS